VYELGWPVSLRWSIVIGFRSLRFTKSSHIKIVVTGNLLRHAAPVPNALFELLLHLSRDTSSEVRSFAVRASLEESARRANTPPPESKREKERLEQVALFSRPPILSAHETEPNVTFGNSEEVPGNLESLAMGHTMNETNSHFSGFNGYQGDVDMDTSYDTAVFPGQLGLSSNSVSGVYHGPSSASSSYIYNLGGATSDQVQVPV